MLDPGILPKHLGKAFPKLSQMIDEMINYYEREWLNESAMLKCFALLENGSMMLQFQ